ncbi:UNVERIFIED_CONTAM: hypothetical protein FKN15_030486 [Acipenser sinensis]
MVFNEPCKDQCALCTDYRVKEQIEELSEDDKTAFEDHMKRKQEARTSKEQEKQHKEGKVAATFDLQQVFCAPKLQVGSAYYLRKLCVFNLTVFQLDKSGKCYMWSKNQGGRGGNEIASAVSLWLKEKDAQAIEQKRGRPNRDSCILEKAGEQRRELVMADFDEIYEEDEDEERAVEEQLLKYSPDPVVVRGSGHVTV